MQTIPYVVERTSNGERTYDLFSRLMEDGIIVISGDINNSTSSIVVSQLLYLDSVGINPIRLYINSPGGVVSDGLAIIDTMKSIQSEVHTTAFGTAASMAAVILAAGEKGHRNALKHSVIMIHQVLGNIGGKMSDIRTTMNEMEREFTDILDILSEATGKDKKYIEEEVKIDKYMRPDEAKEFGLIDNII